MKKTILACTVAFVAFAAQQAISADSVRSGPPADVPWQAPNARALNGKAENQLNVNSANTANTANSAASANYAANAGALGGGDLNWVRNNAVYAHSAGTASTATTATTANTANTANTAITATNADNATNATNAANAANAAYATSAGNGVTGVSGSTLTLANGSTINLPSSSSSGVGSCDAGVTLIGGKNAKQCCDAGGNVVSGGGGQFLCKITAASCPSGWTAYGNWTATAVTQGRTCSWPTQYGECLGWATCWTTSHAFSNATQETCQTTWRDEIGNYYYGPVTYATVTDRGCQ